MKLFINTVIFFILASIIYSQTEQWNYKGEIKFTGSDTSWAAPYLCAVDQITGRLYVASSKIYGLGGHNAVYYADPGSNTFTKLIDYDLNGDSDTLTGNIGFIRGISMLKNDVLISASVPYQRSKPNTVGTHYYYPNGDTTKVEKFGFYLTGSGYGTYLFGSALTPDSFAICGVYQSTMRFYNFTKSLTSPARGSYIPPAPYPYAEIGGHDPSGVSIVRDIAVVPNGDYTSTSTPYFTSRNANLPAIPGGIGRWELGTTASPKDYQCQRVQDPIGALILDNTFPYGITVDKDGLLWVCGTDTTRRWVKGFQLVGAFALEMMELPAQYSSSNADPTGAPLRMPADVAFSADGKTAYVIDVVTKSAHKFTYGAPVSVNENNIPQKFELMQNYPNPFNPATLISYNIPNGMNVKLTVTNSLGQNVAILVDEFQSAGKYIKEFNAKSLPSGIYFYTLSAGNYSVTKKMVISK